jgi:hypothetical protein
LRLVAAEPSSAPRHHGRYHNDQENHEHSDDSDAAASSTIIITHFKVPPEFEVIAEKIMATTWAPPVAVAEAQSR